MGNFDGNGDLWIEVDTQGSWQLPRDLLSLYSHTKDLGNGSYCAVTKMNLTAYIKQLISNT